MIDNNIRKKLIRLLNEDNKGKDDKEVPDGSRSYELDPAKTITHPTVTHSGNSHYDSEEDKKKRKEEEEGIKKAEEIRDNKEKGYLDTIKNTFENHSNKKYVNDIKLKLEHVPEGIYKKSDPDYVRLYKVLARIKDPKTLFNGLLNSKFYGPEKGRITLRQLIDGINKINNGSPEGDYEAYKSRKTKNDENTLGTDAHNKKNGEYWRRQFSSSYDPEADPNDNSEESKYNREFLNRVALYGSDLENAVIDQMPGLTAAERRDLKDKNIENQKEISLIQKDIEFYRSIGGKGVDKLYDDLLYWKERKQIVDNKLINIEDTVKRDAKKKGAENLSKESLITLIRRYIIQGGLRSELKNCIENINDTNKRLKEVIGSNKKAREIIEKYVGLQRTIKELDGIKQGKGNIATTSRDLKRAIDKKRNDLKKYSDYFSKIEMDSKTKGSIINQINNAIEEFRGSLNHETGTKESNDIQKNVGLTKKDWAILKNATIIDRMGGASVNYKLNLQGIKTPPTVISEVMKTLGMMSRKDPSKSEYLSNLVRELDALFKYKQESTSDIMLALLKEADIQVKYKTYKYGAESGKGIGEEIPRFDKIFRYYDASKGVERPNRGGIGVGEGEAIKLNRDPGRDKGQGARYSFTVRSITNNYDTATVTYDLQRDTPWLRIIENRYLSPEICASLANGLKTEFDASCKRSKIMADALYYFEKYWNDQKEAYNSQVEKEKEQNQASQQEYFSSNQQQKINDEIEEKYKTIIDYKKYLKDNSDIINRIGQKVRNSNGNPNDAYFKDEGFNGKDLFQNYDYMNQSKNKIENSIKNFFIIYNKLKTYKSSKVYVPDKISITNKLITELMDIYKSIVDDFTDLEQYINHYKSLGESTLRLYNIIRECIHEMRKDSMGRLDGTMMQSQRVMNLIRECIQEMRYC